MKENGELTREDILVESDMEVSDDNENMIVAYVEAWFDVDRKFGIQTLHEDGTWVNIYAMYDVEKDSIKLQCVISKDKEQTDFEYEPTKNEEQMLKDVIGEKLREYHDCTPEEFCHGIDGMVLS